MALFTHHIAVNHQTRTHDDAGDKASDKQLAHADARHGSVQQQRNGRRDNHTDGSRGSCQSCAEGLAVSMIHHLGDHESAHSGNGSHSRTRDCGKEHAHDNGYHAQATGQMSHQRIEEVDQPLGDTAAAHQVASQHKERDGQKREGIHAGDRLLRNDDQRDIREKINCNQA